MEEFIDSYILDNTTIGFHKGKVFRVKLSGGIIGAFAANPKGKLQEKFTEMNSNGYRVSLVTRDKTGNLLVFLLRLILLIITLGIWTIANGYYIVGEKNDEQESTDSNVLESSSTGLNILNYVKSFFKNLSQKNWMILNTILSTLLFIYGIIIGILAFLYWRKSDIALAKKLLKRSFIVWLAWALILGSFFIYNYFLHHQQNNEEVLLQYAEKSPEFHDDYSEITGDTEQLTDTVTIADYSKLQGEWVGKFDNKDLLIVIENINKDIAIGYNVVDNNKRTVSGTIINDTDNYYIDLKEPGDDKWDGIFKLSFDKNAISGKGEWASNNGKLLRKITIEKRR